MWCEELCRPRNQTRRMFCVNNKERGRKVTVQPLKTQIFSWFPAVSILNRPTLSCMFSKTILRRLRRSWRFGQYTSDCWPISSRLYRIPLQSLLSQYYSYYIYINILLSCESVFVSVFWPLVYLCHYFFHCILLFKNPPFYFIFITEF